MQTDTLAESLDALHEKYRPTNRLTPTRSWYRVENAAHGDNTDVFVYDEIGWFGVGAKEFMAELVDIDTDKITLHLNSPGGEVFDGMAIYSTLRQHPATVHVIIDSLAASIASVIAMAGDTIEIAPSAMMMVHDGLGLAVGNAGDHREMADLLDKVSDNIAGVYAARTGGTSAEWRSTMISEKWFTATEAVEAGLADSILDLDAATTNEPAEVAADFDISVFTTLAATVAPAPAPDPPPTFPDGLTDANRKAVSA